MKNVRIAMPGTPRRSYPVHFCSGPDEVARRIAGLAGGSHVFLVTDDNVHRRHGKPLERMLAREGVRFRTIVLPPGERTKNRRSKERLEDIIVRSGAERGSFVVAFGGGVVGDLAGFAAATLFRGIRFIQVPTTLLAQVDSSIGGKVGVDHPAGKNLIGAFHHPEAVLIAPRYLATLPGPVYVQGMAEVIKCALVLDGRLFLRLRASARPILARNVAKLSPVIARCCALKGSVVAADERETGYRRILNFGHTIGHALEHASRYRIPHGSAVSIGMAVESGISLGMGMITPADLAAILGILETYGLPVTPPRALSRAAILRALPFDKKKSAGVVRYTLLGGIGKGIPGVQVPRDLLGAVLGP